MNGANLPDPPRRLDTRPLQEANNALEQARRELGTTPAEFASERLEDARPELIAALKYLDCREHRDLHIRLGGLVLGLDDLRAVLAERSRS